MTLEKDKDGSCKQDTFEIFSTLKGMWKVAHNPEQDEFSRTEEFGIGVIVVEQENSKIEFS